MLHQVFLILSYKQCLQKTKKKTLHGTKLVTISTVALITYILTARASLAAGLVSVGIIAADRGFNMVVGGKILHKARIRPKAATINSNPECPSTSA